MQGGPERGGRKVVMTLTSEDIIQEVFDRMGLVIRFNAGPLEERIEETED